VGIRVPNHGVPRAIVEELGQPILSTSIHDEDEIIEYSTDPELIFEKYQNLVDVVIDGGYGSNVPSTILDCTGDEIVVVREGLGLLEEIL
jgi:tRNA A37 threonylcarbamoyladenosine synthetase subunit TsaC/SUA5/YrdC